MSWTVEASRKVKKALPRLPRKVREAYVALALDIESGGPVRGDWLNYGKLGPKRHHCHIKTGKPTYVAVWETPENTIRFVEVTYVGTHANAPY